MDWDMRPVYRWSYSFGRWVRRAEGRMLTACRWVGLKP